MKKNARFFAFLLVFLIIFTMLVGCDAADRKKDLVIVCTIFPVYDWMRNVVGENEDVDVVLLLDDGIDLHNFQPTMDDMALISDCDVFVYVGGESDDWTEDVFAAVKNDEMTKVNLLEVLGDKAREEEEVKEDADGHEHEHDEKEYDEHVWLSLKNAEIFVNEFAEIMADKDAKNAEKYQNNAAEYVLKLSEVDSGYADAVADADVKTLVFADRFPFLYLCEDYGLKYYAAFNGCSTETRADMQTITFLAGKIDELDLKCILQIEGQTHDIAVSVKNATKSKNQSVLSLNSLQSVTAKEIADGVTYLSVMQSNLYVLKIALKNGG